MSRKFKIAKIATTTQSPPRLIARLMLMLVPLFMIGLIGMLWGGSNLPETSRYWFGCVLIVDIIRPGGYSLGLIIVGWAFRKQAKADPLKESQPKLL